MAVVTGVGPHIWNTLVAGSLIVQDNRKAIDECQKATIKAKEAVRCTVRIAPRGKR